MIATFPNSHHMMLIQWHLWPTVAYQRQKYNLFRDRSWSVGPIMPFDVYNPCIARINASHTFIIGPAFSQKKKTNAFLYNKIEDKWTNLNSNADAEKYATDGSFFRSVCWISGVVGFHIAAKFHFALLVITFQRS